MHVQYTVRYKVGNRSLGRSSANSAGNIGEFRGFREQSAFSSHVCMMLHYIEQYLLQVHHAITIPHHQAHLHQLQFTRSLAAAWFIIDAQRHGVCQHQRERPAVSRRQRSHPSRCITVAPV